MGYNVVAICDLNSKRLKTVKKKIIKVHSVTNIAELEKLNIDICVLATLADSHNSLIKKIYSLGIKKILSEKPITNNIQDSSDIKSFVKNNDVQIEVYHPALFSNEMKLFKASINKLDKGRFIKANLSFKSSGIGNIGSHVLSSLLYLTQIKINQVKYANLSETDGVSRGKKYFDPNGIVVFGTESGGVVEVKNNKYFGFKSQKIFLDFENVFISMVDGKKLIIQHKNEINKDEIIITKDVLNNHLYRYKCLDNAIKCLLSDEESHSLEYAIDAVELILSSHLSHKQDKCISIPLSDNTPRHYNFS